MNKVLKQEVQKITKCLISKYQPEKIILFGSGVNGKMGAESDLDIFVVKKTALPFTQRYVEVVSLFPPTSIPVDFIVYTPQEFTKAKKQRRFFLEQVLKNGKVLYEKS